MFLQDIIGITDKRLIDAAAYALFAHWNTRKYKKFVKHTHTLHEVTFAKESLNPMNNNPMFANDYLRDRLEQYPVSEMANVLGWSNDYQRYVENGEIITSTDLRNKMRTLHSKNRHSKKISKLGKALNELNEFINSERLQELPLNHGRRILSFWLNRCHQETDKYISEHTSKSNASRVTWLKTILKPMLNQQYNRLSLADNQQEQNSESQQPNQLAPVQNLGNDQNNGLSLNNRPKIYSVANPSIEITQNQAVISAKAAGASGRKFGHTIIYIEYFPIGSQSPTIVKTELGQAGASASANKGSRSLFLTDFEIKISHIGQSVLDQTTQQIYEVGDRIHELEQSFEQEKQGLSLVEFQRRSQEVEQQKQEYIAQEESLQALWSQQWEEMSHLENAQTIKSWTISTDQAINAVEKAVQVQDEAHISRISDNSKKEQAKRAFKRKYQKDYKGYRFSATGGRHFFNFWKNKKLMNCARYGAKILKAAGISVNPGKYFRTPKALSPTIKF